MFKMINQFRIILLKMRYFNTANRTKFAAIINLLSTISALHNNLRILI